MLEAMAELGPACGCVAVELGSRGHVSSRLRDDRPPAQNGVLESDAAHIAVEKSFCELQLSRTCARAHDVGCVPDAVPARHGRLVDDDAADGSGCLEPCSCVDDVACCDPLAELRTRGQPDDGLAGRDCTAYGQIELTVLLVQLSDRVDDA
jgi:hypothetical protein